MLKVTIPSIELFDDEKQMYFYTKEQSLQLEHSLVSLSKWESKWHKPFLTKEEKTFEETVDYIKCMTITQNVNDDTYTYIPNNIIKQVQGYIEEAMTATTFSNTDSKAINKEIVTAEIIYYWMIALNIPFECQKWHLNKLITLINVCNVKNQDPKKMSRSEIAERNRNLNAARRKALNSKG